MSEKISEKTALQKLMWRFSKFSLVGAINTAIDFGIFNVLIFLWGIHSSTYLLFKSIAFIGAVGNSYLWNRYWVFKEEKSHDSRVMERILFFLVSLFGLGINAVVSYVVYIFLIFIHLPVSDVLSANIGALVGTCTVLIFNFIGYQSLVFKNHG